MLLIPVLELTLLCDEDVVEMLLALELTLLEDWVEVLFPELFSTAKYPAPITRTIITTTSRTTVVETARLVK